MPKLLHQEKNQLFFARIAFTYSTVVFIKYTYILYAFLKKKKSNPDFIFGQRFNIIAQVLS